MESNDFRWQWPSLYLIKESKEQLLSDLFKGCGGELKGGIMFYNHQDEIVILKCDEDGHCFKKIGDDGDEEKDWEWIGDLLTEQQLRPYL